MLGFVGGLAIVVGIALATAMLSNGDDETSVAETLPTATVTPPSTPEKSSLAVPEQVVQAASEEPSASPALSASASPKSRPGEEKIVIAKFARYVASAAYNVGGRLRAALEEEMKAGFLPGSTIELLSEEVRDEVEAQAVAQNTNASIVIWGEYDSGRVLAHFTVPGLRDNVEQSTVEQPIANPSDLTATINTALPHEVRLLALLTFAQLYENADETEQAQDTLTEALTPRPDQSDTLAMLYFRMGFLNQVHERPNPDKALHYYTLAAVYSPDSPTPYFNRGLVYASQDDLDSAIADYTESLVRNARDPSVLGSRGIAYLNRKRPGDVIRAVDDLSKSIALDDTVSESFYARGLAYFNMGEGFYEDALTDLMRSHEFRPDDPDSNRAVCWILIIAEQAEDAIPYCDVAVDGGVVDGHITRGAAYLKLDEPGATSKAVSDFTEAIREDPSNLKAYMSRGRAYFKLGEAHYEQSIADLQTVLAIDPNDRAALNNLCWNMSLMGRSAEALTYCDRAVGIDPDYHLAYDSRGLAHALEGQYDEAVADFTKFMKWVTTQPAETYDEYGASRESWIAVLTNGENPFDEAELLALRNE